MALGIIKLGNPFSSKAKVQTPDPLAEAHGEGVGVMDRIPLSQRSAVTTEKAKQSKSPPPYETLS